MKKSSVKNKERSAFFHFIHSKTKFCVWNVVGSASCYTYIVRLKTTVESIDRNSKPEVTRWRIQTRKTCSTRVRFPCKWQSKRFDRLSAVVQHRRHIQTHDRWMITFYRIYKHNNIITMYYIYGFIVCALGQCTSKTTTFILHFNDVFLCNLWHWSKNENILKKKKYTYRIMK